MTVLRVVTALVGVALILSVQQHARSEPAPPLLAMPFDVPCTVDCWDGIPACEEGKHEAWAVEEPHSSGEPHATGFCADESCDDKHPTGCGFSDEDFDVEDTRVALLGGDAQAMANLLEETPNRLEYNAGRQAIQVFDCDGNVAVHFPISGEFAKALETQMVTDRISSQQLAN